MIFKNLPVYRIAIDLADPDLHMTCISIVDDPAIEEDFLCFSSEKELAFAVQDTEQHIVAGPAIVKDKLIYRYSPQMGEYYCMFDAEAIDKIIFKYSKENLWNTVSLNHDGKPIDSAVMVSFFKKDSEKGISPVGYDHVPDGSLFVSYKITDEELWNQIKNGNDLNGFSIEISADLEPTDQVFDDGQEEDDDWFDELMALLEELGLEVLFEDQKKKVC